MNTESNNSARSSQSLTPDSKDPSYTKVSGFSVLPRTWLKWSLDFGNDLFKAAVFHILPGGKESLLFPCFKPRAGNSAQRSLHCRHREWPMSLCGQDALPERSLVWRLFWMWALYLALVIVLHECFLWEQVGEINPRGSWRGSKAQPSLPAHGRLTECFEEVVSVGRESEKTQHCKRLSGFLHIPFRCMRKLQKLDLSSDLAAAAI